MGHSGLGQQKGSVALDPATGCTRAHTGSSLTHRSRVRVWHSARVRFPKWHLDRTCPGLDGVEDDWRAEVSMSMLGLLTARGGRPCRMCTLEPVLGVAWNAPSLRRGPVELVTFSGQPNPRELSPFAFGYRDVTESGAARLRRVASAVGLSWVDGTPAGPVAWGHVHAPLAALLACNLRTVRSPVVPVDSPAQVKLVWEMLVNRPPEVVADATTDPALLWTLARAMVAPSPAAPSPAAPSPAASSPGAARDVTSSA